MTYGPSESTPDVLLEVLPELASWQPRSRATVLRALVAYAEQQYRAAGQPRGESLEGLMRWLAHELVIGAPQTLTRLATTASNAAGLAEQLKRDLPER